MNSSACKTSTPPAKVDQNVLTPLNENDIVGTSADERSIMCYHLPAFLISDGHAIPGGLDINKLDRDFANVIYPQVSSQQMLDSFPTNGDPEYTFDPDTEDDDIV